MNAWYIIMNEKKRNLEAYAIAREDDVGTIGKVVIIIYIQHKHMRILRFPQILDDVLSSTANSSPAPATSLSAA